ncbi:hypothetical protein HDU96_008153 [Phlyctochytrium bullatum]|nr:hypothetical protein HDU96_008153 [Phlyctochytrium bullatum]
MAIELLHVPVVKILLEKGLPVEPIPGDREPPALLCALHQQDHDEALEILRLLLHRTTDINRLYEDRTALYEAADWGCCEAVQMLLEFGADVNATDSRGRTAMHGACDATRENTIRILLDHGASVDPPLAPLSPLHEALKISIREIDAFTVVKMLVRAGANLDSLNEDGETPLHLAVKNGQARSALFLLESGAKPSIKCKSGLMPLQLLPEPFGEWNDSWEALLEFFIKKGVDTDVLFAAGLEDPELMEWLEENEGFDDEMRYSFQYDNHDSWPYD